MMTTITVDADGTIDLPEEVLQRSQIKPGAQLLVLAREGRIVLFDRDRFARKVDQPARALLDKIRASMEQEPDRPFFDGLTLAEYAALSDEAEQDLWEKLAADAEEKVSAVERDIPAHFRPAG